MEQMTKEKKSSGSSHVDEMQRMRARINELEAAEEQALSDVESLQRTKALMQKKMQDEMVALQKKLAD